MPGMDKQPSRPSTSPSWATISGLTSSTISSFSGTILTQGDPALNKRCHPVTKFDGKLADLLDDLKETLSDANGAGLAAPQIGTMVL